MSDSPETVCPAAYPVVHATSFVHNIWHSSMNYRIRCKVWGIQQSRRPMVIGLLCEKSTRSIRPLGRSLHWTPRSIHGRPKCRRSNEFRETLRWRWPGFAGSQQPFELRLRKTVNIFENNFRVWTIVFCQNKPALFGCCGLSFFFLPCTPMALIPVASNSLASFTVSSNSSRSLQSTHNQEVTSIRSSSECLCLADSIWPYFAGNRNLDIFNQRRQNGFSSLGIRQ